MKAIIVTTNDIIIVGKSTFIGCATIEITMPELPAYKVEKLYELDVTMQQHSIDWSVQIAKKHIKAIQFIDE